MKERIVIIFIAVTLGLLATTIGFFLYESSKPTKTIESNVPQKKIQPQPESNLMIKITEPADESITSKRTIQVKGKTDPENTIIISTNQEDVAVSPASNGDFTVSITIDAGVNKLITEAISPNGESTKDVRIISFSPEEF